MKTITITKTSMASGNVVKMIEFTSKQKAETHFNEIISELGYDNISEKQNSICKKLEAGGTGHDYLVELEMVNI